MWQSVTKNNLTMSHYPLTTTLLPSSKQKLIHSTMSSLCTSKSTQNISTTLHLNNHQKLPCPTPTYNLVLPKQHREPITIRWPILIDISPEFLRFIVDKVINNPYLVAVVSVVMMPRDKCTVNYHPPPILTNQRGKLLLKPVQFREDMEHHYLLHAQNRVGFLYPEPNHSPPPPTNIRCWISSCWTKSRKNMDNKDILQRQQRVSIL